MGAGPGRHKALPLWTPLLFPTFFTFCISPYFTSSLHTLSFSLVWVENESFTIQSLPFPFDSLLFKSQHRLLYLQTPSVHLTSPSSCHHSYFDIFSDRIMMKHLSSPCLLMVLHFVALSMVYGMNIDNALQYRQVVPRGTGPSTSNAAQPSRTSTPLSTAAASETSSTSISDSSASSSLSSAPSISTSGTADIVSTSVPTSSSESSSSFPNTITSGSNARSQALATTASSTNVPVSTSKTSTGSNTASSSTQQILTTVIVVSGSITQKSVVTTSGLLPVSSQTSTSASSPTPDSDNSDPNSPGLEPSQKRIIVGVVVGIGGAILLGGLAVVAWRIWGRRKISADEIHELMDSQPGSSSLEKRSSVSGNSPFRSTLDQYHNPAGPVNTASNF